MKLPGDLEQFSSFRFMVAVDGINYAAFTEFTLPSLQTETQEIKEGGQNAFSHKLPVRVTAGSATLRQGVSNNFELLKWYMDVLKGDIAAATRQVTVVMLNADQETLMTWTFRNAYPVKWGGPTFKTDSSSVAIEEIEFVHHGFEIV
ncbi:MAG: phage tail protein [Chloroflexi bacterium]|nr:phage tail protein [Chloroflexota bacterium]MCC6891506.1 phage tail protein [Anaerolineae bacterium]